MGIYKQSVQFFHNNLVGDVSKEYGMHKKAVYEKCCMAIAERNDSSISDMMREIEIFHLAEPLKKFAKSVKKTNLNKYAMSISGMGYYPISSTMESNKSSELFEKTYTKLPYHERAKVAKEICKLASSPGQITMAYNDPSGIDMKSLDGVSIGSAMLKRAETHRDENYIHMGKALVFADRLDGDTLLKTAFAIEMLDRKNGISQTNPLREMLDMKKCAQIETIKIGDSIFSLDELKSVPAEIYKRALSVSITPENLKDAINTLPKMDQKILEKYLNEHFNR